MNINIHLIDELPIEWQKKIFRYNQDQCNRIRSTNPPVRYDQYPLITIENGNDVYDAYIQPHMEEVVKHEIGSQSQLFRFSDCYIDRQGYVLKNRCGNTDC